jgi:hypothetical protein
MGFGRPGGLKQRLRYQGAGSANHENLAIENIDENQHLANLSPGAEKQNPGALAGATGDAFIDLAIKAKAYIGPVHGATPNALTDRHRQSLRMFIGALRLNDGWGWSYTSAIWRDRLEDDELSGIAFAALCALSQAEREAVFRAAQWGGPSDPLAQPWVRQAMVDWRAERDRHERRDTPARSNRRAS